VISRSLTASAILLLWSGMATPQQVEFDRDASARDYVQFQVEEISQWVKDFPQRFYTAAARPPVDISKLSDAAKTSPDELAADVKQLAAVTQAKDLMSSSAFKEALDKTLGAAKLVNQAMGSQRFPEALQGDWAQIRVNLNNLAAVYKLQTLAYLAPPGGGRGGRGGATPAAAKAVPPGALVGYVIDQSCALKGKGMWTNAECIARCIRDGDKVVLITEEGKVYQIANPDKIESDTYGQKVIVAGKLDGETVTVSSVTM